MQPQASVAQERRALHAHSSLFCLLFWSDDSDLAGYAHAHTKQIDDPLPHKNQQPIESRERNLYGVSPYFSKNSWYQWVVVNDIADLQ